MIEDTNINHSFKIDENTWINGGIFIFLWLQFNLKIAALGIAVIVFLLVGMVAYQES